MAEQENVELTPTAPAPRKSRKMSLEEWQAGGGVNGNFRTVPRAEQLLKAQMEGLEKELLKPRSPWGSCTLPNGILWASRTGGAPQLLTEVKLYEMTGEDYNVMNDDDSTYYAKVHKVLGNVVKEVATADGSVSIKDPAIIGSLPYGMMFLDRLFLLYAVRRLAQGDVYPFVHACPKCKMDDLYAVDLTSIQVTPMADPSTRVYTTPLPSGGTGIWHVLCGSDERELSIEKDADRKKNSLTRSVAARMESLTFQYPEPRTVQLSHLKLDQKIKEVNKLGGSDLQALWDHFNETEGDLDSKVDLKCQFCNHEFPVVTHTQGEGFFFPLLLLRGWKKNLPSV